MKILWLVLGIVWVSLIYFLVGGESAAYAAAGYLISTLVILLLATLFKGGKK